MNRITNEYQVNSSSVEKNPCRIMSYCCQIVAINLLTLQILLVLILVRRRLLIQSQLFNNSSIKCRSIIVDLPMRSIVIDALGFLGNVLVDKLILRGDTVIAVDHGTPP
jgi:hypothetical protein